MKEENNLLKTRLEACHNIVLTGAPGTGKTYMARQIAAQMVLGKDDVDIDNLTPEEETIIKERTAFVQFHPSYDYTDFVEGLRPVPQADGSKEITFERRDGIFKEFCRRAAEKGSSKIAIDTKPHSIEVLYDKLVKDIQSGNEPTLVQKEGIQLRIAGITSQGNIQFKKEGTFPTVSKNAIVDLFKKCPTREIFSKTKLDHKKDGNGYAKVGWDTSCTWAVMNYLLEKYEATSETTINAEKLPYVFIIDEINRGELSKIFGELFFSIDPGYRGKKEMRVQTQYQNLVDKYCKDGKDEIEDPFYEGFYVPNNVYIIGTMNDIDRSIESMDFAIRRRFAWVEVKANDNMEMLSKLGDREGKARQVMMALNKAIWDDDEKKGIEGLSRAYHIGASYFLKLDKGGENLSFEDLWNLHLGGLLREYLRGLDDADEKMDTLKKTYNESAGINR